VGEDLPPFPDRYITSCVLGRVDLVDIISQEQYQNGEGKYTPKEEWLKEKTESPYQFVVRNPMMLDLPLKMPGQPGIYKLPS